MNNTWIKLYRKANDKGLMKDHLAWVLFSWLLINVDRETGSRTIGRFLVSEELGINPSTFYKVVQRLEKKWGVISVKSNNKYSTVWIVNWAKYQHRDTQEGKPTVNKVQTDGKQSNTKQELENRELKNIEEEEQFEKIPNNLVISRSQILAYAKEFVGITSEEIKTQRELCNRYMAMSSSDYSNPGLFFRKWLERYWKKEISLRKQKRAQEEQDQIMREQMQGFTPDQLKANLERFKKMKEGIN